MGRRGREGKPLPANPARVALYAQAGRARRRITHGSDETLVYTGEALTKWPVPDELTARYHGICLRVLLGDHSRSESFRAPFPLRPQTQTDPGQDLRRLFEAQALDPLCLNGA